MQVFDEIKTADKAEAWLRTALSLTSARSWSFGHRVYKKGTLVPHRRWALRTAPSSREFDAQPLAKLPTLSISDG
jgi:citrate synthase/2-methylcitrate synthase